MEKVFSISKNNYPGQHRNLSFELKKGIYKEKNEHTLNINMTQLMTNTV